MGKIQLLTEIQMYYKEGCNMSIVLKFKIS